MNKNCGIGILIFSFGLSSVNPALAAQAVDVSPVVVQPYDLSEIKQQMLEQDRINRDQELAIKGLMEDNQRLADTALVRQQDATLEKINQTMIHYRDFLLSRDRARIMANGQRVSKYADLIKLTEDVDGMKSVGQTLQLKSNVIEEKYIILTDLKNAMMALNEKLKSPKLPENFEKISQGQETKISRLTQHLGEMDQKIAHFDEILAQKDRQIAQLQKSLTIVQSEAAAQEEVIKDKKDQVDLLKSELENKISQLNNQGPKDQIIKEQEGQIVELKAKDESIRGLTQALAAAKNKAQYFKLTAQLEHITMLKVQREAQSIKDDFAMRAADRQNRMQELENRLTQKEQQVDLLKTELKDKIAEEKNQNVLMEQIQDLKTQLQEKEDQISAIKSRVQSGQESKQEADSLIQQLAAEQDKADQLKGQLEIKITESDKMTAMIGDYQKKLESKDNAFNQELRQVLLLKNHQAQRKKQIAYLNVRLQEKEAQVITIKKDMYDLQKQVNTKNMDLQTKDLNLYLVQQKMMDEKINGYQEKINKLSSANASQAQEITSLKEDLALAREELKGMPSSDELNFLRAGLDKAALQLKQKDAMLAQIKAKADGYADGLKTQSQEFQSTKDQLKKAKEEFDHKNEDLKYKDMALTRLKETSRANERDLKAQMAALTRQVDIDEKKLEHKTHGNKVQALQAQLKSANLKIKELQAQLKQWGLSSKKDIAAEKLKQALGKIDEQGRLIDILVQKLQDCGRSADLTKVSTGK